MKLRRSVMAWLLAALLPVAPAAAEPITLRDDVGATVTTLTGLSTTRVGLVRTGNLYNWVAY